MLFYCTSYNFPEDYSGENTALSDHRLYLSIMTPAASSGTFDINVMTTDASANVSLTVTVTGVTASEDEIAIAKAVESQLVAGFAASGCTFVNQPVLSTDAYVASFRVTRGEHCVCVWSQANFEITIDNDTTGSIINNAMTPSLLTVSEAKNRAAITGVRLVDMQAGTAWTNAQIADAIQLASAELVSTLRNNIVLSSYMNEFVTKESREVQLRPFPLTVVDQPLVRRDDWFRFYTLPQYGTNAYNKIFSKGILDFRYSEAYVWNGQPFELGNEVRVSFIAGWTHIPEEIQTAALMILEKNNGTNRNVESLGGGSLRVKWFDPKIELYRIYQPVLKYKMTRPRG